jgi:tetratricopeptide (TPR) repeat protein
MSQLGEARKIAPDYALVHHYRANVAFLMGDRETAIAALERALELEPDNVLYQRNLAHLQSEASTNEGRAGGDEDAPE